MADPRDEDAERARSAADTRDVAALLAATDRNGQLNRMAFEAERLILQSQALGTVDADRLVQNIQSSGVLQRYEQDAFLEAIDRRLQTPAEQRRVAQALDTANITDGLVERQLERAWGAIGDAYDTVKDGATWTDKFITGGESWAYKRADELARDPNATEMQKATANLARDAIGKAQEAYGFGAGGVEHTLKTLQGFVDLGQMGYRFTREEPFRDLLLSTAKLYAVETMDDPSKPLRDVRNAAGKALDQWEKDLQQAKAEGRERDFLGRTEGAIGVEIVATLVPISKLGKFGKLASSLERVGAEGVGEAAELAADANRVLRRAEAGAPGRVAEGLGEGAEAVATSARAVEAAKDVIRAEIKVFRDQGNLDELIEAVHKTGNIEGFLRSGELSAKELTGMLKQDPTLFSGKVGFQEALDVSTKGVNLATLSSRQLGDIGEAIQTFDLVKKGYTDIVSVKNASGHGIDLVARNPEKELEFFEIKTSGVGKAAAQRGDPEDFIASRLQRAIDGAGHWDPKNTMPGMKQLARDLNREISDANTGAIGDINAKWVQINLSRKPGSIGLDIEKTVEDWVRPAKRASLERDHPDFPALETIQTAVRGTGRWNEGQVANISAEVLRNQKLDPLTSAKLDKLHVHDDMIYAVRSPWGEQGPHFRVGTPMTEAAMKPAEQSLAQVEQINQQRVQDQALAQQRQALQPEGAALTGPSMGARSV